jgi:hypothetical protein
MSLAAVSKFFFPRTWSIAASSDKGNYMGECTRISGIYNSIIFHTVVIA